MVARVIEFAKDFWRFTLADFRFIFSIFSSPGKTLRAENLTERFAGQQPLRVFVLPMAFVAMLATILGLLFSLSKVSVDVIALKAIFRFAILVLSYYILCGSIRLITQRWFGISLTCNELELFVVSVMSVTFSVQILLGLFPMLFFFNFVYIYISYLVWLLINSLIPIRENSKNRYIVIVTLLVIFLPLLIEKLLLLLIPNVA